MYFPVYVRRSLTVYVHRCHTARQSNESHVRQRFAGYIRHTEKRHHMSANSKASESGKSQKGAVVVGLAVLVLITLGIIGILR